jgi:hypothetical protein
MEAEDFPTRQWAGWREDFEAIKGSLVYLAAKRKIHRAYRKALGDREIKDGTGVVHDWMDDNYADSILIGLRRIIDESKGSFSLVKILEGLKRNRSLLSFERYSKLLESTRGRRELGSAPSPAGGAKRVILAGLDAEGFGRMLYSVFSSDGRNLEAGRIDADIGRLRADHSKIRDFINTIIAHRTPPDKMDSGGGPSPEVTWEDVDQLFDDVGSLFNKYYSLVNPGVHVQFEPTLPAGFEQAFARMLKAEAPANHALAPDGFRRR